MSSLSEAVSEAKYADIGLAERYDATIDSTQSCSSWSASSSSGRFSVMFALMSLRFEDAWLADLCNLGFAEYELDKSSDVKVTAT